MTDKSIAQEIEQLIDRATNGQHSEPCKLNNFAEYFAAKTVKSAVKKVAIGFDKTSKLAFKDYLSNLKRGIDAPEKLFQYKLLKECYDFYVYEYNLAFDALDEFENFALLHPIRALLGENRRE